MGDSRERKMRSGRSFTFFGIKLNGAYFGLSFSFSWFFGIQRLVPVAVGEDIQGILFIGVALSCLIFAAIARARSSNIASARSLRIILSLVMATCSLVLVVPNPLHSSKLAVMALGLLGGMLVGWQYIWFGGRFIVNWILSPRLLFCLARLLLQQH